MSASKKDHRTKRRGEFSAKHPVLRRNDHDMSTACNPAPLHTLPPLKCPSSAFGGKPLPGCIPNKPLSSQPAALSVAELPRLVAKVGPEMAIRESLWTEGPCIMASALGTDIPFKVIKHPQEVKSKPADENVPKEKCTEVGGTETGKVRWTKCGPLTGTEVFEIFAKKKHLGELQFYYLRACDDGAFRPYDLRVVPRSKAGLDHYIFSPTSVIHVQDGCSVDLCTLASWYREMVLWKALRDIPFFRTYLLRKGFTRWHRNVRQVIFQRRRGLLHTRLLVAIPQFRDALFHITRLLEELKSVHWLPQDESTTYTLLEFQTMLSKIMQQSRGFLERFLHYRYVILSMVWDFSHRVYQELQHEVELCQQSQAGPCQGGPALRLQRTSSERLHAQLRQAGHVLQKLGSFSTLVDHIIIQGLVTVSCCEVMAFRTKVLKRRQEAAGSVFQAELMFGADGQLAVSPPLHLLQEALLGALCSVRDSVLQVVHSCSNLLDSKESTTASFSFTSAFLDFTPQTSLVYNSLPLSRAFEEREPVLTKDGKSAASIPKTPLPKRTPVQVHEQRVRLQYCALSRTQLEWHLQLHAGTQEVENEQARITQEAVQEICQLCESHSWMVDAYLYSSQWRATLLESKRGWPVLTYQEHLQKVELWIERVRSAPASFTTSSKLLTVNCSRIRETLEPLLKAIQEDVLKLLSEEMQLRSENLISELKKAVESLKTEPTDFIGLANYACMVKCYTEMSVDMQPQIEYICSLQKIIQLNCRSTSDKGALVKETLDLWDRFVPVLEQAAETVARQLPRIADTLDRTFSSLTEELRDLVGKATAGPYLHPNQNARLMNANLGGMCRQLHAIAAQMNDLSRISKSLRGHPLDLTFVTMAKQTVEGQKELWELLGVCSAQIQEWKGLLFSKFMVSRAQEKVNKWLEQAASLANIIPSHNAVLQETLHVLESFNQQLSVLVKLNSPSVKHKHWRDIFMGMGLLYVPDQNLTVGDLMTNELWEHRNKIAKVCREAKAEADVWQDLHRLQRSWDSATFRLAKFIFTVWKDDPQLGGGAQRKRPTADVGSDRSGPLQHSCDSGTFTIIGLDTVRCQAEDSVMTLSSMLFSLHAAEFRREVEHWVQLLQELQELLDLCERFQKKWVFLSKVFYETFVSTQKVNLLEKFSPVDKTFREIIQVTLSDPHVLNFVRGHKARETNCHFHGQNLHLLFIEGLQEMENISSQLLYLLDSPRSEFPRLCFLSDGEVMKLLSLHLPNTCLLPLVCKCFRAVQWLDFDSSGEHDMTDLMNELDVSNPNMRVKGVYGSLREHVPFSCSLDPHLSPVVWLGHLEKKLQQTVKQLIMKCIVVQRCPEEEENEGEQDKLIGGVASLGHACTDKTSTKEKDKRQCPSILQLILEYPLQCLLVSEEVLWCSEIQKVVLNPAQTKWVQMKAQNAAKLRTLCQAIQDIANSYDISLASRRTVTALRALVLLTMKHSQQVAVLAEVKGSLESAFEWKRLLKYRHSAFDKAGQSSLPLSLEDPNCKAHSVHIDVLGTKLAYGYEYIGPENWMMVNTPSTERAFLGILLTLNNYRCAFITGPLMSGKKKTVLQLGWALGQQVIMLGCYANTSPLLVSQMLLGALQTGAWLVLNSVDSMEQGTLSVLGQQLTDIHQCLSTLQVESRQEAQEPHGLSEKLSSHGFVRDPIYTVKQTKQMLFGGKHILAKLSYGCVIISSLGCSAEVPDNLRVASRSVSLMKPDYSIITEVLLVSLGFSQAANMSRRLISLFSLAKDSFCLPDFVSGNKSSWLVLLQKVIHASGTQLYRKFDDTDNGFLTQNSWKPVGITLTASDKISQETKDDCTSIDKFTSNCSIVNSIREEKAVIKAIMSVLVPAIFEHHKASQFCTIFEEIFPIARSFPVLIEEHEQNVLSDAITEELQQTGFCADTQMLHNTVTLHKALQFSNAVVLLGPPGSGKTTMYQALARALRRLAAKSAEAEFEEGFTDPGLLSTSRWSSVDTVVLFPNALSHEELFGGFYEPQGSWWDGAFTKVLRDTEQQEFSFSALSKMKENVKIQRVKWLVLDGEPLTHSYWFDCLSTLGDPENPFICLSSGEKIQPSQKVLKLVVEATSLADANPSALTRCSLVYVSGKDLWKAVWKTEMESLYRKHTLDQSTLKIWSCLAEDLFSSTLNFLRHKELNSVMSSDRHGACLSITDGLQEIMSFIKILHALLGESGKGRVLKCASKQRDAGLKSPSTEVEARNLFVVAYIWGFGGHLHPRHWPQFDLIAREALFESRYKIEVPPKGMVFDHFFNFAGAMVEHSNSVVGFTRNRSPKHFCTTVPQYGKYAYLLDLMLESLQSALIVGETGSGKTMLGMSLLSQKRPHVHLPVNHVLCAADLRDLLESTGSQKTRLDSLGSTMQHPGLLLFLDDLHEAPFDIYGKTSMTLETLRQCISRGGVPSSDGCHFKTFSSGAVSYLSTCSTAGTNNTTYSQISPRLSRLFTVLALPSTTVDILFSIHSTQLQQWLKSFPSMSRITDLARSIVSATFKVYLAVRENFLFSRHTSQFVFSLHDLKKVFQGMCLWDTKIAARQVLHKKLSLGVQTFTTSSALPVFAATSLGPVANVLNIARLWMHECLRTFGDRMSSNDECQKLVSILTQMSEENFGSSLVTECHSSEDLPSPVCQLKGKTLDYISQSQCLIPVPQDMEGRMTPSTDSVESSMAGITKSLSTQVEKSEWSSEEQNSSDYSLSSSETEDCYSTASSNRSKKENSDRETPDSASSSASCSPQIPPSVSPKETKLLEKPCIKANQSTSLQQVRNWSDVSTRNMPQDSSKTPLQLLTDMASSIRNVVFSPEVGEPSKSAAEHQFRCHSAYLERDLGMLVQQVAHAVAHREEGDAHSSAAFAVYHQRVRQLTHILRTLLIPSGHGVLFGAETRTGRKSTVRLAAFLIGYQLIEVHHGNESKLKEIWNEAGRQIGMHGGHMVFLIHEDVSQAIRDELLVVMATGKFPRHYTDEKLKVPKSSALVNNPQCHVKDDRVFEKYFNTQRNMHVFLLLPLNHDEYARETRHSPSVMAHITKALSLCCCVELYQPWSSEALVEIASWLLQIPDLASKADKTLEASIVQVMAGIHKSATKYASTFLNIQLFGPQTYIELIAYFCHLYDQLCEENRGHSNRVATVLTRVKEMIETAQIYSKDVLRLKETYDNTHQSLKQMQKALAAEHKHCQRIRQYCLLEENRLSQLEGQLEQAEQQAQDALKQASPLYQAALKTVRSLNQCDLDEVRHYRRPPEGVVILMDTICLLFNRPCNWESCKQLLGQPSFLQELEFFDRSKLSTKTLEKLSEIVQAPNFQPHAVRSLSRACESLCCWARAVHEYACAQRLGTLQEALERHLAGQMAESRARLRGARLQEEASRERLEDMERQQQLIQCHLDDLSAQLQKVTAQEKDANAVIKQVRFFTEKWSTALKETEMNSQTVSGDAVVAAASVAYLGPFSPEVRLELLEKWQKLCFTGRINISPEDPRTSLIGDEQPFVESLFEPIPVGPKLHRTLARAVGLDRCVVHGLAPHLVLKLLLMGYSAPWAHHWALLAHTQQYEELSSQTQPLRGHDRKAYKVEEYELILSADDPELLDKLSHAAKKGLKVLVTHIEQAVPTEELLSMLARPAGRHFLGMEGAVPEPHPAFHMLLSTALPVHALLREIDPLILGKVKVIDLSLSTTQIEDVILSDLLQSECLELWVQHCQATSDKHIIQDNLHLEQASLMQYILQSVTPLLQDPAFLPRASACQSMSQTLQAQLEGLSTNADRHTPLWSNVHHLSALATAFYRALKETERLSPFYHFRLSDFLIVLQQALALKGRPSVPCSGEAVMGAAMSEISHRVMSYLFAQYRPCLFQSHAELLKLLVTVSFVMHNEGCSETERIIFLKGLGDVELPEYLLPSLEGSAPGLLPNWISPHVCAEVHLLDQISPFHGLVSSLKKSSRQWQEYMRFPSSTVVAPVPCQSHSHLTMFQRAILWKTLFPEWLAGVARDLASCQHGQQLPSGLAGSPCIGSPESLSSFLSKNKAPVIVTLPGQRTDESGSIHPLYWIKQAAQYQADRKGVKVTVISFGTECQRATVLSALDTAVQTGHWLVLNNCHLLYHWDVEVIAQLKQLISCTMRGLGTDQGLVPDGDGAEIHVHPHFRLWFITEGSDPRSVPAIVRIHALHLACDSHWDLKNELCDSLRRVLAAAPPAASPVRAANAAEPLLLRCAILHSVLLQRQKPKHLAQGSIYNWTQEDLFALVDAQVHIAQHCTDPTAALEYIAAYLTYGGHVTDSADLEAVKAVCRVCLHPPSPAWGNGPHTLAEIINMTAHSDGYSDEKDLLRRLERCVQTTLNITEAQALGFSEGMSSELMKVQSRTLSFLLLQSQSRFAANRQHAEESNTRSTLGRMQLHAEELSDYRSTLGRLQALTDQMEWQLGDNGGTVGTALLGPLRKFLQTEWNHLRETVSSMMRELSQPVGDLSASPYTTSTISELETRADLLRMYQQEGSNRAPYAYCLSAFTKPLGFLASLLRETTHDIQRDTSHASLHFQVLGAATSPSSAPSVGVYLCGLELHGAVWDTRFEALHSTVSNRPCPLPLLWVRALVRDSGVTSPDPSSSCSSSMPVYHCPLYVHSQSTDGARSLSEENIITHVPLKARLDPALCTLRRVRLVSTLKANRL